ncbi:5-dehydro-4-deoxyglucarate dehydratase [Kushneria sinocarnis]|uniref:Probable 5-dehydro-4-deoxyglucarate dehydratase n=1 Tax=Kushneria sinocarnis TaxID=595502 RepID=A0A420WTR2_9GAMM|nr:5-dehydro-4-deoxyglucarate dehydratase [Kushneria sinocarnis]RKQ96350.1 5-dehydro-4-deoxyglucarate dehydratase [Kushneria sinocarnis]
MHFDHQQLRAALSDGLLSFPITDFDQAGEFDVPSYEARLEWLRQYDVSALFVAGGTGEFFSLTTREVETVVNSAVRVCGGRLPILSSAGRNVRDAIEQARIAEEKGADGLLLMPPYLTECPHEGLVDYVSRVCAATNLGVVLYNRANGQLDAASVLRLTTQCPNLIGFKDGVGNIQALNSIIKTVGDRLVYIGGVPTAEIFAEAYMAIGVNTYSSAVFNFVPEEAVKFYQLLREGRTAQVSRLVEKFFVPFVALREHKRGYAVSLIKAGAELIGHPGGSVRTPLVMPSDDERAELERLIGIFRQMTR